MNDGAQLVLSNHQIIQGSFINPVIQH